MDTGPLPRGGRAALARGPPKGHPSGRARRRRAPGRAYQPLREQRHDVGCGCRSLGRRDGQRTRSRDGRRVPYEHRGAGYGRRALGCRLVVGIRPPRRLPAPRARPGTPRLRRRLRRPSSAWIRRLGDDGVQPVRSPGAGASGGGAVRPRARLQRRRPPEMPRSTSIGRGVRSAGGRYRSSPTAPSTAPSTSRRALRPMRPRSDGSIGRQPGHRGDLFRPRGDQRPPGQTLE